MLNWSLLQNKMFTSTFCCSYSVQSSDPSENNWHLNVCCLETGSPSSSSRSSPAPCPSPDPPESVRHPGADHAGKSLLFVGGEVVLGGAANLKVGWSSPILVRIQKFRFRSLIMPWITISSFPPGKNRGHFQLASLIRVKMTNMAMLSPSSSQILSLPWLPAGRSRGHTLPEKFAFLETKRFVVDFSDAI